MLVLSRKAGESIFIGKDVEILVCQIRGDKAKIGIKAPKEFPVHRKEVFDKINNKGEEKT